MSEVAGKVYPVHSNQFKFGLKGMDSKPQDMATPKDLENFAPTIDGTVENWFAMDAEGWFGPDVMTQFEWTMVSGAKLTCPVVINVTTPGGGDTTGIDALEFDAECYGKPTITPAPATPGIGG